MQPLQLLIKKKKNKKYMNEPKIDLSQAEDIVCENCGSDRFIQVFTLKRISALLSPIGKELIYPFPALFECQDCGHVNKQFLNPTENE